ncbi:RNA polymerase factor sigma-54 [uncultured Algimonas sp.]|uniref:RNA polymerase factor sigma-54 n=1 Tax=uncultured Algimonas sp. TaxID=1547920 RepID=UPI002635FBED|nr:RNA polymerase factor sigma-54 [uncultured Algimonas sp.]
MALAPNIVARQTQSLAMTPQLQQAIKLLQLSNIELAAFVEEQLEKNPLLERGTGDENRRGEEVSETPTPDMSAHGASLQMDAPGAAQSEMDAPEHSVSDDSACDSVGTAADVGGTLDFTKGAGSGRPLSDGFDIAANAAAEVTLQDHLRKQFAHLALSPADRPVADYLLGLIDDAGYLREETESLALSLGVPPSRIARVIAQLQTLEPTGVFARSLAECLSLQLSETDRLDGPNRTLLDHLDLLARHDLPRLTKLCKLDLNELKTRVLHLRTLSPKPGLAYGGAAVSGLEPDVFVRETPQGGWAVELNSDTLPRVLVNKRYYREIKAASGDSESAREFLSDCHQSASWLVKSLDQRARTILKVASEIVRQQDAFFAYGVDHMRPLKLKDVSEAIEMHESTVSRVTSGKFMATPRGTVELKFFFTAAIASTSGGEGHSAEAVRHRIQTLVDEETDSKSVKSDDRIVELLRAHGVEIARRTVAKYRDALGIPSSVERRRIIRNRL